MRTRSKRIAGAIFATTVFAAALYPIPGSSEQTETPVNSVSSSTPPQDSKFAPNSVPGVRAPDKAAAAAENSSGCLTDVATLEDIKKHRDENEEVRKQLAAKETDLKAREQALNEEMKKLEQARDDISKIDASRKKENDERVNKLVDTFQSMSPKAAAELLAELDEALAVATINRMETVRLAKIMNKMEAGKSSRLSEILAGVVRARKGTSNPAASHDVDATTEKSARGGDRNDGQNEQQQLEGQLRPRASATGRQPSSVSEKGKVN